jgi:hypothetical protein
MWSIPVTSGMAVFLVERFIAHRQQQYELDESNNGRNECPEEDQIKNAQANLAKIEFVTAEAAQEESKQCGGYPAFAICCHRPEVYRCRLAKLADATFWAYFRFEFDYGTTLAAEFLINAFGCLFAHGIPLDGCGL